MTPLQTCRDLGHQWPKDVLVLAVRPKAIAEIVCARCGVVRTTTIDDIDVHVRWVLDGVVIEETTEPRSDAPPLRRAS